MKSIFRFCLGFTLLFSSEIFSQESLPDSIPTKKVFNAFKFLSDSTITITSKKSYYKLFYNNDLLNEDFEVSSKKDSIVKIQQNFYRQSGTDGNFIGNPPQNMLDKFSSKPTVANFSNDLQPFSEDLNKAKTNIKIALFDLDYYDYKIPVFLYNNYPVKVKDNLRVPIFYANSRIGGDWSLSIDEFKVARNMNGLNDEHPTKGYFSSFSQSKINGVSNISNSDVANGLKGDWDSELDVFNFSTPTISGSFVLDLINNTYHNLTDGNFTVKYSIVNNKLNSFTIVDEKGINYLFGGSNTTIEETQSRSDVLSKGYDVGVRIKRIIEVEYYNSQYSRVISQRLLPGVKPNLFPTSDSPSSVLIPMTANEIWNEITNNNGLISNYDLNNRLYELGNNVYGIPADGNYSEFVYENRENDPDLRRNTVNTGWFLRQIVLNNGKKINFNYRNTWEAFTTINLNNTVIDKNDAFAYISPVNGEINLNSVNYYDCMPLDISDKFPINETIIYTHHFVKNPKLTQIYDEDWISLIKINNVPYSAQTKRPYVCSPYELDNVPQDVLTTGPEVYTNLIKKITMTKWDKTFNVDFFQTFFSSFTNGQRNPFGESSTLDSLTINNEKKYVFEYYNDTRSGRLLKKIVYPTKAEKILKFKWKYTSTILRFFGANATIPTAHDNLLDSIETISDNNSTIESYEYFDLVDYPGDRYFLDKKYRPDVVACDAFATFESSSPISNTQLRVNSFVYK